MVQATTVKQLPVYPTRIHGRLHHALPHSIISRTAAYEAWFKSNYIQLYCPNETRGSYHVNFFGYFVWMQRFPCFYVERFKRSTLARTNADIISFIQRCIDDGLYFYTYADEFYVPLFWHERGHVLRDFLIHGYNAERRTFDVVGVRKDSQIGSTVVSFDDFLASYESTEVSEFFQDDIFLLKELPEDEYEFDPVLVKELLDEYLHSRNTSTRFRMRANPRPDLYGMSVYDQYIEDLRLTEETKEYVSFIPAQIIMEHKQLMVDRIAYMADHAVLDPVMLRQIQTDYEEAAKRSAILRSSILKHNRLQRGSLIKDIISDVCTIRTIEQEVLGRLLDELHRNF
ncbi:hypothetical protein DUZ99_17600 [Xylanibacillus composti]|uniref:Butirosin biosynthesis protein H-like n=1 Tax=Xylanibacillus composti TaxID=1572762 RepID=A0A8J4M164_9BACL|nr:hypothetical protein [Xylanibacillus composti]MDT9726796.1 hypothetical protein [Xylanibacillus composti]GIQ67221.1 hypothetical protein XYCOK13_00450 [Xylanibacillus composti]